MTARLAAVVGWPIEHSRSPAMHNAGFAACVVDAIMVPFAVPPPSLPDAVRGLAALGALGASVTVPHKAAAVGLCDELSATATAIAAVNCMAFVDGRIVGHNTDADGFIDGLRAAGVTAVAGPAIILGGGGAAQAVVAGLTDLGVETIVVARRPAAVTWTRARAWSELPTMIARAALIVDCTSAGLSLDDDQHFTATIPLAAAPDTAVVCSLVYHRKTALLQAASARELRIVDGRAMLLYQATRAFAIWTGLPAPIDVMRAALDHSLGG